MGVKYLLDTSVYSQPIRRHPLPACASRWQKQGDQSLAVPAVAIAEIEYGLFLKNSQKLWEAYCSILKGRLETLSFTAEVATTFAEMKARQTQTGKTVDDFDLSIAAIAVRHNLKTRDAEPSTFQADRTSGLGRLVTRVTRCEGLKVGRWELRPLFAQSSFSRDGQNIFNYGSTVSPKK